MSEKKFESKEFEKDSVQYGKKGSRPRKPSCHPEADIDKQHANDITYWNKSTAYPNVVKFLWDFIVSRPKSLKHLISYHTDSVLNPPQIATIDIAMGPGWAASTDDGVNRSLAKTMAMIRATLSTSNIGFETADFGIFETCMSSIASTIGYAKKVLECYSLWNDKNYVYPRALIQALGFSYEDIRNNINVYKAKLDSMIDMFNNIKVVDFSDVYDRQYVLMHSVFCDEHSDLAQLYMFRPLNYYKYVDTPETELGISYAKSKAFDLEYGSKTFDYILNIIDEQIQAWYSSSDLYQINGVINRAFKDAPVLTMPKYEIGTRVEPVQDRSHTMQIMNMTIHGSLDMGTLDITQDPATQNYLIWKPCVLQNDAHINVGASSVLLRVFEDDVLPDDNMEMTRLVNMSDTNEFRNGKHLMTNCGSEIVHSFAIHTYDTITNELRSVDFTSNDLVYYEEDTSFWTNRILDQITAIQPFRYIPCIRLWSASISDTTNVTFRGMLGDLYNWKLYSKEDWLNLQFVAFQSIWEPKFLK